MKRLLARLRRKSRYATGGVVKPAPDSDGIPVILPPYGGGADG